MKKTLIAILCTAAILPASSVFAATAVAGVNLGVNVNASASAAGVNVGAGASTSVSAKVTTRIATIVKTAQSRADQEITRRIAALNALSARVNAMVKLSADEKTSLSSQIQSQIATMNNLQAQIATDAAADATSSLKTDIQSITKSYRIFALIIPQGALDAAADRVLDIAGMMTTLSGQLQARGAASSSAATSAFADMNAKIADANTQANAAITEIANLQPDNGNQTVMASNTATLKNARSKVQAAQQDLVAARKDANTIVKALRIPANASSTITVTASGTAQ